MRRLLVSKASGEVLETLGLWLIIAGLIGEAALVFDWVPLPEKPLSFIFTLVIAAGVWLENVGAVEISSAKDAKLTEALNRASRAEEALLKYRRPRRALMSPAVKLQLSKKLSAFSGTPFDTGFSGDGEAGDAVWDIEEILMGAKWSFMAWGTHAIGVSVNQRNGRPISGMVLAQNVELHLDPSSESTLRPAAEALVGELIALEIDAAIAPFNVNNTNRHAIHILVGPKR